MVELMAVSKDASLAAKLEPSSGAASVAASVMTPVDLSAVWKVLRWVVGRASVQAVKTADVKVLSMVDSLAIRSAAM